MDSLLPDHIRGLMAPGIVGSRDTTPELVQTHASYVLLSGDRVYKLKKARDLGFLDYSTLERRREACEAELRLNRRLTSNVYLAVEPVRRRRGRFALGGEGETVDYAVVMRRLPAERMMDRLVERDAVSSDLLARLARHLAAFYAEAPRGEAVDAAAAPEALLTNWQENFLQTFRYAGRTIGVRRYRCVASAVYRDLLRLRPIWRERIAAGRARDGHGDLRLSAVCFEEQAIQVYDCIEFNERFRFGDVAADIAFLVMDLDGHGRTDLADEFVACFVLASGDTTLPALLPFYCCYRAYVRGKVDSFQLDEPEVADAQRRQARAAARRRFALASDYVNRPATSLAVVSGEHAELRIQIAAALAARMGAVVLNSGNADALDRALSYLRARIPAVLSVAPDHQRLLDDALRLAARPLRVACGPAGAPKGATVLSVSSLRQALLELRGTLGTLVPLPSLRMPAQAMPAGAVRAE